jgi:hypothetical protein
VAEPHDQLGDLYNPPWAGLWLEPKPDDEWEAENFCAGYIFVIQPRAIGTVDFFCYDTDEELRAAWLTMEETISRTPGLASGENPG